MESQSDILYYLTQNPQGPKAELLIALDELSAELKLYPGKIKTIVLDPAEIFDFLTKSGIVFGIHDDTISNAILEFNLNHKPITLIIAEGQKPIPAIAEHIELNSDFFSTKRNADQLTGSIDWKEQKSYAIVEKGSLLARIIPEVTGVNGKTITGKEIPFPVQSMPIYKSGKNIVLDGKEYKAAVTGKITFANNCFDVEEVFIVKGDVDYHTGNIIFPGDVFVEGNICEGFTVQSGKSIVVKGNIDAQYVSCAGNLVCDQGIIGHGESYCKVGGNCSAKFIEHMNIAVRGTLKVESAILASKVYCLDKILMGNHGKIVGGEIWSGKGIICAFLGNKIGTPTSIIAGINFINDQKLKLATSNLQKYSLELQYLKKQEQTKATMEKIQKLQAIVDRYLLIITKLADMIDISDTAEIIATQIAYGGVTIRICRIEILIEKEIKTVSFYLDKAKGSIQSKQIKSTRIQ